MMADLTDPPTLRNTPGGCEECDYTGYRGRVGIYEILVFSDAIRDAVRSGNLNDQIRSLARHDGMKLMQEHALELVRDGITTLEEVQRVVPFSELATPAFEFCPYCGSKRPLGFSPEQPIDEPTAVRK